MIASAKRSRRNRQPPIGQVAANEQLGRDCSSDEPSSEILKGASAWIDSVSFRDEKVAQEIDADDVIGDLLRLNEGADCEPPAEVPAYFAALYRIPLLSPELERRAFRKLNYLKWRARHLLSMPQRRSISATKEAAATCVSAALEIRERIIVANLRLVVSIARRFTGKGIPFSELISDGNLMLMNAVEKFDFSRGFRFSTYATLAIQREFVRTIRRGSHDRLRAIPDLSALANVPDQADADLEEDCRTIKERQGRLRRLMGEHLDERQRAVLLARYGINDSRSPEALRSLGARLGISKERVRQLQLQAISSLREVVMGNAETDAEVSP